MARRCDPRVFLVVAFSVAALSGCGKSEPVAPAGSGGHGHAHTPKYGGVLVEVGQHEFSLEVLVDPSSGKLTVWTLDAHAEAYVRIPARTLEAMAKAGAGPEQGITLKPVANPATGEVEGSTAQFEATADWLKGAQEVEGSVKLVTFGTKTFNDIKFDWPHGAKSGQGH